MKPTVPRAPADLPAPTAALRCRRLLQTLVVTGRHLLPLAIDMLLRQGRGASPAALRRIFEEMGATYIKFGQFIASAPGVVGVSVAQEFRSCLDSGPPVPFTQVRATVEKEIGWSLWEAFSRFEEEPMAAASVAVVHRAVLKDGRPVAVKVLRPRVEHLVAADLGFLLPLAWGLARRGVDPFFNLAGYLIGLRQQLAEELDLRNEASAMASFRQMFADFGLSLIVVPSVCEDLSGRRVLTMDLLEGTPIDDLRRLTELAADLRVLVQELVRAWVLTGLHAGSFHADIHAGNLLLLNDGRLGLIDWGIVARLDPDTHLMFRRLIEAALGDDSAWEDITAYVIRVQGVGLKEGMGLTDEQIGRLVRAQMEPVLRKPLHEVSMASLVVRADDIVRLATGEAPRRRSLSQRLAHLRRTARANRLAMDHGFFDNSFNRANFLAAKQLVYLERYARMYVPEQALLGDREFLRAALDLGERPTA